MLDLGGPRAPNAPESAIPGVIVGAFIDDGVQGCLFEAQRFAGLSLAEAVEKAAEIPSSCFAGTREGNRLRAYFPE